MKLKRYKSLLDMRQLRHPLVRQEIRDSAHLSLRGEGKINRLIDGLVGEQRQK
jgi:hypothetical protein